MGRQFSLPFIIFFLCACVAAQTASRSPQGSRRAAAAPNRAPDLLTVINGLEAAQRQNHAHMVPYTVTREYQLFSGQESEPKSTVIAEVSFRPPSAKTFAIKQVSGSSRGEKVVRHILEREVRFAKDGKISFSRQDYDFRLAGIVQDAGRPCYALEVIPKRSDSDLLRGQLWVDQDTYLIHHFQGAPAKSPSWWLKDVEFSMNYGDLGGMWLQTLSQGSADVRLLGIHSMTERTLDIQSPRRAAGGPVAELARLQAQSARPYRPSPIINVGVGVMPGR